MEATHAFLPRASGGDAESSKHSYPRFSPAEAGEMLSPRSRGGLALCPPTPLEASGPPHVYASCRNGKGVESDFAFLPRESGEMSSLRDRRADRVLTSHSWRVNHSRSLCRQEAAAEGDIVPQRCESARRFEPPVEPEWAERCSRHTGHRRESGLALHSPLSTSNSARSLWSARSTCL